MAKLSNYNDGNLSSVSPHYNDWDEAKKYLQMLFVPGRSLQSRELTQLQNFLQLQVDRLGTHFFNNGDVVAGGETIVNDKIHFVRLDPDAATDDVTDYTTLKGLTLTEAATGVQARVVHVDATVTDDDPYPVIFVEYTATSTDGNTSTFSNASLLNYGSDVNVEVITSAQATDSGFAQESNGEALLVSMQQGIFFVDGFFALADEQSYAPYSTSSLGVRVYTNTPTVRIGLTNTKSTIDIAGDSTLGDTAIGSNNYSAPGAYRLKFDLSLTSQTFTAASSTVANTSASNFIELFRLVSGKIRSSDDLYGIRTDVSSLVASRTENTLGDFVSESFSATKRQSKNRRVITISSFSVGSQYTVGETVTGSVSTATGSVVSWDGTNSLLTVDLLTTTEFASGDNVTGGTSLSVGAMSAASTIEHFDVVLGPGKAYIDGKEFETNQTKSVTCKKARELSSSTTESATCDYGNYFICSSITGGLFDINEHEQLNIMDYRGDSSSSSSYVAMGTCNVKHVEYDTSISAYRVYVYNVNLSTSGYSIADVGSLDSVANPSVTAIIDATNGVDASGNTVLFKKSNNISVFELPKEYIDDTSGLTSITYHYRIRQTATSGADNTVAFSLSSVSQTHADDQYYPFTNTTTSDLSSIRKNYILVNQTTGTNITAGTSQVVTSGDSDTATFTVGTGASHITSGDVVEMIAVVKATAAPRVKVLQDDYLIPVDLTMISNEIDLGISDVVSVSSVLDAGNSDADVTSKFIFDNGQRDNVYDYAKLILKTGESVTGPFTVTCDYYLHSGSGPLTINSYTTTDYEDIPVYTSTKTGRRYALRDCVDFRPAYDNRFVASSSSSSNPETIDYSKVIIPSTLGGTGYNNFTSTFNYYLPRIDKIVLTKDRDFKVLEGLSSLDPVPPCDLSDAVTLYTVEVPTFTPSVTGVKLHTSGNRKYSMKDVGSLEERINDLEYYTSLSLLEQKADSIVVKDVNSAERFKNGILVDSFNGHSIGDVNSNYYACSMDFKNGILRPPFVSTNVNLSYQSSASSTNVEQVGDYVTLKASSTDPVIEQPLASTSITINPFNKTNWIGSMTLTPDTDTWFDVATRPDITSNPENVFDSYAFGGGSASPMASGFGTEWNDWERIWSGVDVSRETDKNITSSSKKSGKSGNRKKYDYYASLTTPAAENSQTYKGIRPRFSWEKSKKTIGDRVVYDGITPYMRAKTISVSASGMKPNTTVYAFFDDTNVAAYITGTLQTDSSGSISVSFALPASLFKTGKHLFRLTDSSTNVASASTTSAEAIFVSSGLHDSWKTFNQRSEVTSERILEDVASRSTCGYVGGSAKFLDPLAQTFYVDANRYPNGMFLKSVDLFFKAKDASLPVGVEIRPATNGYPHPSKVVPNSYVEKLPSAVNVSDLPDPSSTSKTTTFTFRNYIYLEPGQEYALVVKTNSSAYKVFIAESGQTQLGGTTRITEQPYAGALYRPQNASTWTPDHSADLTFRLNRCVFSTGTSADAVFYNDASVGVVYDTVNILMTDKQFSNAGISYGYKGTPVSGSLDSAYTTTSANTNIAMSTQHELNTSGDFVLRGILSTSDDAISPVINVSRASLIAVENKINNSTTGETSARPNLTSGALTRYITRRVTLDQGLESKDINVYLTASKPQNTDIKVYYRALAAEDDTPFNDASWVEMSETTSHGYTEDDQVIEYIYKPSTTDSNGDTTVAYDRYTDIQTFAIKIVLLSTNTSVVPEVHDMKAIAVD